MLQQEQFDRIAMEWLERNLTGHEAQESLASQFQQIYRIGITDTSSKIRHITAQLSEIGIATNV